MHLKEVFVRGDTLEQVKYKAVKLVHDSYNYLSSAQAVKETARELCLDPKTVESILEKKGGQYEEIITKIPAGKRDKAQLEGLNGNSEKAK